jgi:hypothetical protein
VQLCAHVPQLRPVPFDLPVPQRPVAEEFIEAVQGLGGGGRQRTELLPVGVADRDAAPYPVPPGILDAR